MSLHTYEPSALFKEAVKELMKQARRQIKHHGHLCGYPSGKCDICTPTRTAIFDLEKIMKVMR
jgi:hypothetical protein